MIKSLLCGLTVGSVGTLLAMQYHIVRTDERFVIVSRVHQPPLRSSYVDIRHWSAKMWEHYPELQEAVVKAGRQDLMAEKKPAASAGNEASAPIHDVSQSGTTSILNTTEARSSEKTPGKVASSTFAMPKIALGAAETGASVLVPAISSHPDPIGAAGQPVSVAQTSKPAAPVTAIGQPAVEAKSAAVGIASNEAGLGVGRDWVQNLLKTIVPSHDQTAEPKEQVAVPEMLPDASPIEASESAVEDHFPASPRRISIPGGRDI